VRRSDFDTDPVILPRRSSILRWRRKACLFRLDLVDLRPVFKLYLFQFAAAASMTVAIARYFGPGLSLESPPASVFLKFSIWVCTASYSRLVLIVLRRSGFCQAELGSASLSSIDFFSATDSASFLPAASTEPKRFLWRLKRSKWRRELLLGRLSSLILTSIPATVSMIPNPTS